jgi:hypothetical protein
MSANQVICGTSANIGFTDRPASVAAFICR